jgi:hypothetical protein
MRAKRAGLDRDRSRLTEPFDTEAERVIRWRRISGSDVMVATGVAL